METLSISFTFIYLLSVQKSLKGFWRMYKTKFHASLTQQIFLLG